jgi:hypothetical protein
MEISSKGEGNAFVKSFFFFGQTYKVGPRLSREKNEISEKLGKRDLSEKCGVAVLQSCSCAVYFRMVEKYCELRRASFSETSKYTAGGLCSFLP